jgi:glycine dehydrogenase
LLSDKWDKPYSREKAVWPVASLKKSKFWPTVGRLDDGEPPARPSWRGRADVAAAGDLNLICECGSVDEYSEELTEEGTLKL